MQHAYPLDRSPPSPHYHLPATCPVHALVADDSDEHRWLVQQMLEPLGFEVAQASDGRDLFWRLEALRHAHLDVDWVVVTDVRMPIYGGLEVLEAWRDDLRPYPVVVMTAFPDEAVATRVQALGGLLLAKPFTLDQLRKTLARACASPRAQ
jgi:CheY-like chemotaxis protein